jgi:hypothetical protein
MEHFMQSCSIGVMIAFLIIIWMLRQLIKSNATGVAARGFAAWWLRGGRF